MDGKRRKNVLGPQQRWLKGISFTQILNTLITLKQETDCRTGFFEKNLLHNLNIWRGYFTKARFTPVNNSLTFV